MIDGVDQEPDCMDTRTWLGAFVSACQRDRLRRRRGQGGRCLHDAAERTAITHIRRIPTPEIGVVEGARDTNYQKKQQEGSARKTLHNYPTFVAQPSAPISRAPRFDHKTHYLTTFYNSMLVPLGQAVKGRERRTRRTISCQ